jgi:hypothetical protein
MATHVAGRPTVTALRPKKLKLMNGPGGDIIREMIGAFPSATLAEGEYVARDRAA